MSNSEKKVKISSTAYRVLLLLQQLNKKNMSIDKLNDVFLKDHLITRFFSKDVILKYISTLRTAGYDISRFSTLNKYFYKLQKAPLEIDFSKNELRTLAMLKNYAFALQQKKFIDNYSSFLDKVSRYMSDEVKATLNRKYTIFQDKSGELTESYKEYSDLIKNIEKYISERQRVEVKYRLPNSENEELVIANLQKIKYETQSVHLVFYDFISAQTTTLNLAYITSLKQLPSLVDSKQTLCPVIFKVKGPLAKVYRLYEGEKLTQFNEETGESTITAYSDNVDLLIERLLKYHENCEILHPKQARDKIKTIIENSLLNYK